MKNFFSSFTPRQRPGFFAVAFLAFLPFLFFWRQTLGWLTLAEADAVFWFYPAYHFVAEQLKQGQLPLWNPYLYGGMPLFGQWQAGVLDPLNWIYLISLSERTLTLVMQLTFSLALLGMYSYLRQLSFNRRAAVFAAIIYGLSGFIVARTIYPGIFRVIALTPWVFLFLERLAQHRRWRDAAFGALFVAWQMFAAHPQPVIYAAAMAAAYALFRMQWRVTSAREWLRLNWQLAAQSFCLYLGGLGLAGLQLLPVAEMAAQSVRREWPYEFFTFNSLHPYSLLGVIFPFLHGQGRGIYRLPYWGPYWHSIEATIYLGGVAVTFALVALYAAWRWGNDPQRGLMRFWSLVAGVGLLLALGRYFPPLARVLFYLPVWGQMRSPNRHWLEVIFALAVLCGWLMQRCLNGVNTELKRWFARVGTGLATIALTVGAFGWLRPGWLQVWLRALPDLQTLPPNFLRATQAEFFVPMLCVPFAVLVVWWFLRAPQRRYVALVLVLLLDLQLYAHFAPVSSVEQSLTPKLGQGSAIQVGNAETNLAGARWHQMLPPEGGEFNPFWQYRHEFITGYDPLLNTRYKTFTRIDEAGRSFSTTLLLPEDRTLDLLNVRYVTLPPGYLAGQPAVVNAALNDPSRWRPVANASPVAWYDAHQVYENLRAQPRAWLVGEAQVVTDWYQQLQRLRGERKDERGQLFDPRRSAIVETSYGFESFAAPAEPFAPESATILARQPGRLLIETDAARAALLVISEMAYPGWQAIVDGQPVTWRRVNYMLCGVPLSAGKHRIEFFYHPSSVKNGAIVSFITALILLVVIGWSFRFEPEE